jgi:uncharacterized protein
MTPPDARVLLRLARQAIGEALGAVDPATPSDAEPWLREPGASFVTLRRDGRLRGCIGSVEACRPLGEDVRRNAVAAALRDPRFPPLVAMELETTAIEVSVLSPLEPLAATTEAAAIAALRPGVDGVLLECDGRRATFLPQVWSELAAPDEFLRQLRRKAALTAEDWSPGTRLWRFTVSRLADDSPATGLGAGLSISFDR